MTDTLTVTGLVATAPRHLVTSDGVPITSFRLASNQRRYDRKSGTWVDAGTNWYTISAFRGVAINVVNSIRKGERVVVFGRLRISDWESGEKRGTNIEIDVDAIGHDLSWGTTVFTRSVQSSLVPDFAHGGGDADAAFPDASPAQADQESAFTPQHQADDGQAEVRQAEVRQAEPQLAEDQLAVPF